MKSLSHWLFVTLWTVAFRLLHPWDFPGKSTRVGCHFLLQRIFPLRDGTRISCIAGGFFTIWAIRGAHFNPLLGTNNTDCVHAKSLQSCPTLCDTMDCSPPGSSVHVILQVRILEWVAISFFRGSSWPRDRTHISYITCIGRQFFITSTMWKAPNNTDSDQIRSVAQSCPTLCDPMNRSTPGLPVHHQPPEFTETHVHRVSDAIQPSHPLSSPSPPAPNPSQHQSLFQRINSSHEVAKVLEFQL